MNEQAAAVQFRGTERFELVTRLGHGATGVVYEAFDHEQSAPVALKVLAHQSPQAVLDFKSEFRILQQIRHANLVELRELALHEGHWFFTMPLVRGVDIVSHVRGLTRPRAPTPCALPSESSAEDVTVRGPPVRSCPAERAPAGACSESCLRASFAQLAAGLRALHAANKIHRDLKPSNVLVDTDGLVTILDFGLVAELDSDGLVREHGQLGTPRYMSPEQRGLGTLGPPSDWYAFGIMLWEALAGATPAGAPLPDDVPADLRALCHELLAADPALRPRGERVCDLLAAGAPADRAQTLPLGASADALFVGREVELRLLAEAWQRALTGEPVMWLVEGASGVGKSALIRHFLASLTGSHSRAACFVGRCFERESLPYKALDGVMDAISAHLHSLPAARARELVGHSASTAARAFPALSEWAGSTPDEAEDDAPSAPHEQRARVFAAVRELFGQLARAQPTIVVIDDLQWADVDSVALLSAIFRAPGPGMLWLLAQRPSPHAAALGWGLEASKLELGPLSAEESRLLVERLLPKKHGPAWQERTRIAAEGLGHPLFLREMVRHAGARQLQAGSQLRLDEVLWARVDALPRSTRSLLELLAVAGMPIAQRTLSVALGVATADCSASVPDTASAAFFAELGELRHVSLVRTMGFHPNDLVEPYHDRIREAVLARLDAHERRMQHRNLALAFELAQPSDQEALALHWHEAGELDRGREHAVLAAERAVAALAFERAAELFEWSLERLPDNAPTRPALLRKLGDSLANAGRGKLAAEAYERAAAFASSLEALDLQRLAAEQLLRCGHVGAGIEAVSSVLARMGVHSSAHGWRSVFSVLWLRARIGLRGFGYEPKAAGSAIEQARIEATWAGAICLTMFDSVQSTELQCKNMLLALRAGTPLQVLRAHTAEAMFLALGGQSQRARVEQRLGAARGLAEQIADPNAYAWLSLCRGTTAFFLGSWREGAEQCALAESSFRRRAGTLFELGSARAFHVWSRMMCGDFREVLRLVPEYIREAESRGDLYSSTCQMTGFSNVAWLSQDDVAEARRMLAVAEARWPTASFNVPRYFNLMAAVHIELYDGKGREAYRRVLRDWRPLRWGVAFRAQITRFGMRFARGLSALAAFDETQDRDLLRDAERCANAIARERVEWSQCFSNLVLAGVYARRQRPMESLRQLLLAEDKATRTDMAMHRAILRHRRGELVGGSEGAALIRESREFLATEEIRCPERMLAMLSPKLSGEPGGGP